MDRVLVAVALYVLEVIFELDLAQEAEAVLCSRLLLFVVVMAVFPDATDFVRQLLYRFAVFLMQHAFVLRIQS